METKPAEPAAQPPSRTPSSSACAPSTCRWARSRWLILSVILAGLAFASYSGGLSDTALFHHVSSTVRDPLPDNSIVRSPSLFWKIWGPEFLLTTRGEYRPLGYAVYALLARVVAPESVVGWHVILICLHALGSVAVFALLRMFLGDWSAFGVAALYIVFPPFALLVNDVNQFHVLVGLFLCALSIAFFVSHLGSGRAVSLIVSLAAFAAAVFVFPFALVVPALMVAAWAFRAASPRAAVAAMVWMALIPLAALLLGQPGPFAIAAPYLPAVVLVIVAGRRKNLPRLVAALVPFAAVAAAFLAVSATVKMPPILLLGDEGIDVVTEASFVARLMLLAMPAFAVSLSMAVLAPVVLLWSRRPAAAAVIAVVFMLIVTVRMGAAYKSDVAYWKSLDALAPGHPLLRFNLASAFVKAQRWQEARDELLYLRYEAPAVPEVERSRWWPAETSEADRLLVQSAVLARLGLVYHALGDDKVAGYYSFPKYLGWDSRLRKHRLMEIGDFCFAVGYLSWAENHYSSALIMDPYDVRLYNALGKCLMYKNFFDAAADHFRSALALDPGSETALYHLAFIAGTVGDDDACAEYSRRWREVSGSQGDIDFQPIFAAYRFDRDVMRMWFTRDPVELLKFATDKTGRDEYYSVKWRDRTWEFSEVPLEAARYFAGRALPDNAYRYLKLALDANPKSRDALALMAETCRKLGRPDEAAAWERAAAQEGRQ